MIELIIAHFIGDYVMSKDWYDPNHHYDTLSCLKHVIMYIIPIILFNVVIGYPISTLAIILIMISHFIQDRFNLHGKLYKRVSNFYNFKNSHIVHKILDDILHIIFIVLIFITFG
jgi:hypothetical protein